MRDKTNKNANKYAIHEGARYGIDQRWKAGRAYGSKKHVRVATDCSPNASGQYVIKGPQFGDDRAVKRFRAEVAGMKRLTDTGTAGVLPLTESCMTETQLWYVMPKAKPLSAQLKGKSFDEVVKVFAKLADTLSRLTAIDSPVSHRDIKPDNLFWYQGAPVLADFGIAAWADSEWDLTADGNKIGPMYFLAPEARYVLHGIDWAKADIYSLAMTFWSIAAPRQETGGRTSVQVPPPGPVLRSQQQFSMYRFGGDDAAALDVLMERATAFNAEDRPTAAEFRDELRAWLALFPGRHTPPAPVFETKGQGLKYLKQVHEQLDMYQRDLLAVIRSECVVAVGAVEWDETARVDYKPREEVGVDDQPRSAAIMDDHGRYEDDEWDGSFFLALRHRDDRKRLVVGGLVDHMGTVDLMTEYQERVDGRWKLLVAGTDAALPINRLTTRKDIRGAIAAALDAATTPLTRNDDEREWIGERVL
ncbi:protein kinase domain-containing protein [Rhodococcus qingshengii]|uniref:protein kinase domain-containing protein n=1 Tax=Rhodococcus qingshengii TaxID=334542 RepID=UPI0021B0BE85|nr:protein kinase [Rhodococcus qingshengii]MCT6736579.1 protein kinase [Rhodococcus qingshengii]